MDVNGRVRTRQEYKTIRVVWGRLREDVPWIATTTSKKKSNSSLRGIPQCHVFDEYRNEFANMICRERRASLIDAHPIRLLDKREARKKKKKAPILSVLAKTGSCYSLNSMA